LIKKISGSNNPHFFESLDAGSNNTKYVSIKTT